MTTYVSKPTEVEAMRYPEVPRVDAMDAQDIVAWVNATFDQRWEPKQ